MKYIFSDIKSQEVSRKNRLVSPVTAEFLFNIYDTGRFDLEELIEAGRQQFQDYYTKRLGKEITVTYIENLNESLREMLKGLNKKLARTFGSTANVHKYIMAGTGSLKVSSKSTAALFEILGESTTLSVYYSRMAEYVRSEVYLDGDHINIQKFFPDVPFWEMDMASVYMYQTGKTFIKGGLLYLWYKKYNISGPTEWFKGYESYLKEYFELHSEYGEFIYNPMLRDDASKAVKRLFGNIKKAQAHFGLSHTQWFWWWKRSTEEIDELSNWLVEYYGVSHAEVLGSRNMEAFRDNFKDKATKERISKEFIEDFDDTVRYLKIEYT